MTTAYVGRRRQGELVVIRLPEGTELTPERSLHHVNHSPSGFEVGYRGSGPAQLACAVLLDYTDDPALAREHYQQFKDEVVSQLGCSGPTGTWVVTDDDIEQVLPETSNNTSVNAATHTNA